VTVVSPWLLIPLADYEAHMALPEVGQAELLAALLAAALREHRPASIAVLGCAGGNGFERVPRETRLVGIDVNPAYLAAARARYASARPDLELHLADVERDEIELRPVDLVFAGLVLEYVDAGRALDRITTWLAPRGILATVLQLPSEADTITPSRFASLHRLEPLMRLLAPDRLTALASERGLRAVDSRIAAASGGKRFAAQTFQKFTTGA
jgi:trans-aconitate methyltransferase